MFDEIQREAIRAEAQGILKRFSDKIANVKVNIQNGKSNFSGMRHNEVIKTADPDFKEMMFKNAKNKDLGVIFAEKKSW